MSHRSKYQQLPTEAINPATLGIDKASSADIIELMLNDPSQGIEEPFADQARGLLPPVHGPRGSVLTLAGPLEDKALPGLRDDGLYVGLDLTEGDRGGLPHLGRIVVQGGDEWEYGHAGGVAEPL